MKLIKENTILYKEIVKIFNFEKNSLLSKYELKTRLILRLKYFFHKTKNKLLLCKI
jgi:hypothetical protein